MASKGEFGSPVHLAGRFFGALWPGRPPREDDSWARCHLLPGEVRLWERMSGPDQRHAVAVARQAISLVGDGQPIGREFVAAALLHDVGKVESGLGTFSRVGVTLAALAMGRRRLVGTSSAAAPTGVRGRVRAYLTHDKLGGELLRAAGSHELTAVWAEQHHMPRERWTVDAALGDALKTADGD